jgi:hypothetical protein
MTPLQCLFCDQGNPEEAKFCNECGTPLHFKPCPQCDGINGRFATGCYRCGAAFSAMGCEPPPSVLSPQPDASDTALPGVSQWDRLGAASVPLLEAPPEPHVLAVAHDRVPWRALSIALLAASIVLSAVAWQADHTSVVAARADGSPPETAAAPVVTPARVEPPFQMAVARMTPSAVSAVQELPPAVDAPLASAPRIASANAQAVARPAKARSPSKSVSPRAPSTAQARFAAAPLSQRSPPEESAAVVVRTATGPAPAARAPRDAVLTASLACAEGTSLAQSCDVRALAKGN